MNIEVISTLISFLAIAVSVAAWRIAVRQNKLSAYSIAADWLRDVRSWASECVNVLTEAAYIYRPDGLKRSDVDIASYSCRLRLSALVDRGRFLFPNLEGKPEDFKPTAYQGLRHPALDALVAAERVLAGDLPLRRFPDRKTALVSLRREFVSIVQCVIDPNSFNKDVARVINLASKTRSKDPTLGGLLPDSMEIPPGAGGIMEIASQRYAREKALQAP